MLSTAEEYKKMFEAEEKLWWYKILHEKVLGEIQRYHPQQKNIKILDAGCGTGGMMSFLLNNGYTEIEGFDFSEEAVKFCKQRNLKVCINDILNLSKYEDDSFDVIINNDVMYQFDNQEIITILENFEKKLKPSGLLLTNNQAFKIFAGTHDMAVGAKQRFIASDFKKLLQGRNLKLVSYSYWSLLLSPIILLVRLWQQLKLKLKLIEVEKIESDVEVPSESINYLLYKIVKFEEKYFNNTILGSSLFLVVNKKPHH